MYVTFFPARENHWRYCRWYNFSPSGLLNLASSFSIDRIYFYRGLFLFLYLLWYENRYAYDHLHTCMTACILMNRVIHRIFSVSVSWENLKTKLWEHMVNWLTCLFLFVFFILVIMQFLMSFNSNIAALVLTDSSSDCE